MDKAKYFTGIMVAMNTQTTLIPRGIHIFFHADAVIRATIATGSSIQKE